MRTVKNDLMVSNRYVDVTTMLIDISTKQDNFEVFKVESIIDRVEQLKISGRNIRVQAARLHDAITDDNTTYEDINKLEISDLCNFLNCMERIIITSCYRDIIFRRDLDPAAIAGLRVIEVIVTIIVYARDFNKEETDDNEMPIPKELYHLDEDPNIIEWFKEEKEEKGDKKEQH